MKMQKVRAGEYIYGAYAIIREDVPSMDEFDQPSGGVTWFVALASEINTAGLPDAMFEAGTLKACKEWIANRKGLE